MATYRLYGYKYIRFISFNNINMQQISPIKERILQYIDFKGISKYKFYQDTGITRGVLDKDSGISEDNVAKFIAYAKNININWLISGIGEMEQSDSVNDEAEEYNRSEPAGKRLAEFAEIQKISISDFALKCDLNYNNTASLLKGSLPLGMNVLHKIKKGFPNLNTEWVLFGNGTIELNNAPVNTQNNKELEQLEQVNYLQSMALKDKDKTIFSLENQIALMQELKELKSLDESPIKSSVGK